MRLIDADALTKQLEEMADNEWNKSVGSSKGLEDAIDVVESMPTIKTFTLADIEEQYRKGLEKGLEERPHGEWIKTDNRWGVGTWRCTHCDNYSDVAANFCPNCGASMKEGDEE